MTDDTIDPDSPSITELVQSTLAAMKRIMEHPEILKEDPWRVEVLQEVDASLWDIVELQYEPKEKENPVALRLMAVRFRHSRKATLNIIAAGVDSEAVAAKGPLGACPGLAGAASTRST